MSITINGTGSITGLTAGGLPDGSITSDDIAAGAVTTAKLAAGAGGKILQVLNTIKTDTFSTSSTSFTDITGLTLNITPSSSNSKILVLTSVHFAADHGVVSASFGIGKNGSQMTSFAADAASNRIRAAMHSYAGDDAGGAGVKNAMFSSSVTCLDSPGVTSQITYSIMMRTSSGTLYVNRSISDRDTANYEPRTISTLTLMEVAG